MYIADKSAFIRNSLGDPFKEISEAVPRSPDNGIVRTYLPLPYIHNALPQVVNIRRFNIEGRDDIQVFEFGAPVMPALLCLERAYICRVKILSLYYHSVQLSSLLYSAALTALYSPKASGYAFGL